MSKSKRATPAGEKKSSVVEPDENDRMEAAEFDGEDLEPTFDDEEPLDARGEETAEDEVTPSWFGKAMSDDDSQELANRYRSARAHAPMFEQPTPEAYESYRRRLEERFQSAKRLAASPAVAPFSTMEREAEPVRPRAANDDGNLRFREWQRKMDARQATPEQQRQRSALTPLRIAGLFAVACAIGGVAGLASANMGLVHQGYAAAMSGASTSASAIMALLQKPVAEEPAAGGQVAATVKSGGSTVLTKKPVRMARVDVADASGVLNNPIPLALTAVPADPDMPLALKITGLPGDAYLTQGTEVADGEWLLKPTEIEGVKLVVPQAQSPQLDLAVAGVEEKTGVAATPPREMTVELDLNKVTVQPASAPPESQSMASQPLPQAIPLPQEAENTEAKTLLGKGEALLKTGDLDSARQFFIKAHGMGAAEGAFGAGQTYDPVVYAAMNVRGLEPDPQKAREWYDKAVAAGNEDAAKALAKLNAAAP